MTTYQATVQDAGKVILTTSLKKGERVRVIVETEKESDEKGLQQKKIAAERYRHLIDLVRNNPEYQHLTEEMISEEINAYRRGE